LDIGCSWNAFKIQPLTTYQITVRVRTNIATASGFYFRIAELDSELADGAFYLHNTVGETGGQGWTRQIITFAENTSIDINWTALTFKYTPTSTARWASPFFLNWTGMGTSELYISKVVIITNATEGATIGVNLGGQITAANASTFIASAAIGNAQIGNLSADKINVGLLSVDRIANGTVTDNYVFSQRFSVTQTLPPPGLLGEYALMPVSVPIGQSPWIVEVLAFLNIYYQISDNINYGLVECEIQRFDTVANTWVRASYVTTNWFIRDGSIGSSIGGDTAQITVAFSTSNGGILSTTNQFRLLVAISNAFPGSTNWSYTGLLSVRYFKK
jgi:hypothetical protein